VSATLHRTHPPRKGRSRRDRRIPAVARADRSHRGAGRAGHPLGAVAHLHTRLTWRTPALIAVVMAGYVALEVVSYRTAYPDGVSPVQFEVFEDNPAVRMMNGVPHALDTAGGFTVWDGGWMMQIIVAVWAILVTSRLLRGEEDLDRADLVLAGPVRAPAVTAVAVAVVVAEGIGIGLAAALAMVAMEQAWWGSALFGVGVAGVGATFAALTAVVSQLVEVRRRVVGVGVGLLGLASVLRMVGNSADSRDWVLWTTPMGWIDQLRPFGGTEAKAVVPMIAVPVVLGLLAVRLRAVRDTGGALLAPESAGRSHLHLLSSPLAFAWRSTWGSLAAWAAGVAAIAAIMGALVSTMIDWIAEDEGYQQLISSLGLDAALSVEGFTAVMAFMFGLAVALQVAWRVGAARSEEEAGRLEAVLARPVGRLRWLGGHVLLAAAGAVFLTFVAGAAIWAGGRAAGSTVLGLGDSVAANLNTLPVVALVGGLAVAAYGVLPRLTVPVPVTAAVAAFVLYLVGPALQWPSWILDLSPFTHLALVPAEPWAVVAGVLMTAIGVALAAAGALAFRIRDVGSS
jgi:polyether ionophore transport system permease protein